MQASARKPNILLILSDQERQRRWLPKGGLLPNRQRLIEGGLEFTSFFTHTAPCSPSRASWFTGRYVPQHGVHHNIFDATDFQPELDTSIPTLGHVLRKAGYYTSYIGKWHLSHAHHPNMEAWGFSNWTGDDRAWMGLAGSGTYYDPIIARQAAEWLKAPTAKPRQPWFLAVCLVNPHDMMWFPGDQRFYQAAHPKLMESYERTQRNFLPPDVPLAFPHEFDEVFEELPANFHDDLFTKPAIHRQWMLAYERGPWGAIAREDKRDWLRLLDYSWRLHQENDRCLGTVLDALERAGGWDDTAVIFSSDHGDMTGSHRLRSKGPFVYDEIMRVPLYVRVPGLTHPGSSTTALATQVDVARTILALGGAAAPGFQGLDLRPVLSNPAKTVRQTIPFSVDSLEPWGEDLGRLPWGIRGSYDGRIKYARYCPLGEPFLAGKNIRVKGDNFNWYADFEEQDHEWYDHQEDPHELVNLANDPGRRRELRERYEWLLEIEAREYRPVEPAPAMAKQ